MNVFCTEKDNRLLYIICHYCASNPLPQSCFQRLWQISWVSIACVEDKNISCPIVDESAAEARPIQVQLLNNLRSNLFISWNRTRRSNHWMTSSNYCSLIDQSAIDSSYFREIGRGEATIGWPRQILVQLLTNKRSNLPISRNRMRRSIHWLPRQIYVQLLTNQRFRLFYFASLAMT